MRKAIMYLLLALGIVLGVLFVGGAIAGFAAGYIDGFNGNEPGTTNPVSMVIGSGFFILILLCIVMNWVFLHFRFASYGIGRIPKPVLIKSLLWMMVAMGGLAFLSAIVYVPTQDPDTTIRESYQWMQSHFLLSMLLIAVVEATGNLVLYGAVLREVLDWKHRPEIIIPVFAGIIGLVSGLLGEVHLMIPTMMTVVIEGWVYEYSRSVIPGIIGDVFFWAVYLAIMGFTFPWWCFLIAVAIIIPSAYLTIKTMDPYKPID